MDNIMINDAVIRRAQETAETGRVKLKSTWLDRAKALA